MEPLITTEMESAILKLMYEPAGEWGARTSALVKKERELNEQASRRVLDIFYAVDREFRQIELGIFD